MKTIDVQSLAHEQSQHELDLIDVRTAAEYRQVHATGSVNVPLESIDPQRIMADRDGKGEQPLYLICQSGGRSSKAAQRLIDAGLGNVVSVDGGTMAWESAGLPVERGKKTISLERQVRIVAGFFALLGAVLGCFVHPYFTGISAFIGAGLMFAGITDTCGMGMMLAKMPWNR